MHFGNFTTVKPSLDEQASTTTTFGTGRDIAYLVFSILQFLATVFGFVLVYYIIRNKDKKDEKERLEKEERDKIADIIDGEYNKIVVDGIVEKLRECKAKFQAMVMFHGSAWETRGRKYKITGIDILKYKLLHPNASEINEGMPLRNLRNDLEAVMRLFMSLRIKLPFRGECPENIKEELGPLITEIGEIARSFVPASKRYTIANVLKYFGSCRAVTSKRNEERKDDDDIRKTRRIFPYLNAFHFGIKKVHMDQGGFYYEVKPTYHDQDFEFETHSAPGTVGLETARVNIVSNLSSIEDGLCKITDPIRAEQLRCFTNKLYEIWTRKFSVLPIPDWSEENDLHANVLHAVRVFMFKIEEGGDIINDYEFKELVDKMRKIA